MSSDIDKPLAIPCTDEVFPAPIGPFNKTIDWGFNLCESFFLNLKFLLNSQQTQNYTKIIYSLIEKVFTRYGYRKLS